jgi:uncharacterized protein (TIGR03084 family)
MAYNGVDLLDALATQHHELATILDGTDEEAWQQPSLCPGWSVADVVLHLAQTDEMAVASLEGRFGEVLAERSEGSPASTVDEGAALLVERQRDLAVTELRERWGSASKELLRSLRAADPHRRVDWVAGQLSVRTLAATRLAEAWIHTGDVAGGLGLEQETDGRLVHIARLAWRTLPYAFARDGRELHGPVEFDLIGPGGEPWRFTPDGEPVSVIRGKGVELCMVAARRVAASATGLTASGVDGDAVLSLVRTYA